MIRFGLVKNLTYIFRDQNPVGRKNYNQEKFTALNDVGG